MRIEGDRLSVPTTVRQIYHAVQQQGDPYSGVEKLSTHMGLPPGIESLVFRLALNIGLFTSQEQRQHRSFMLLERIAINAPSYAAQHHITTDEAISKLRRIQQQAGHVAEAFMSEQPYDESTLLRRIEETKQALSE